jgi:hypothetical protein
MQGRRRALAFVHPSRPCTSCRRPAALTHVMLEEYVTLILITALFTVAGGICIRATCRRQG